MKTTNRTQRRRARDYRVRRLSPEEVENLVAEISGICNSSTCAGLVAMQFTYIINSSVGRAHQVRRNVCPFHGALYAKRHGVEVRER